MGRLILPKVKHMLTAASPFKKLSNSLHKVAGIEMVAFTRIYDNNSMIDISDNSEIIEYFYYNNNNFYEDLAPDICPEMLVGEYFLIQCHDIDNPALQYLNKDRSLSHVLTITKRINNYYEIFWFGSREEYKFVNFCLNRLSEFESFMRYFKQDKKMDSVIQVCDTDKMFRYVSDEIKLKNENFIKQYKTTYASADKSSPQNTLAGHTAKSVICLTKRETECLYWCAQGKTNEEIGLILQLSKRTVEHYLEKVKRKLDCFNRIALIRKAIQLKLIDN